MRVNEPNPSNGQNAEWPSDVHDAPTTGHSLTTALEHLFDATQRIITKRIDLALLEISDALTRVFRGTALIGLGIAIVCCSWWGLMAFIVFTLEDVFTLPVRLAIVVVISAVSGGTLVVIGVQEVRGKRVLLSLTEVAISSDAATSNRAPTPLARQEEEGDVDRG